MPRPFSPRKRPELASESEISEIPCTSSFILPTAPAGTSSSGRTSPAHLARSSIPPSRRTRSKPFLASSCESMRSATRSPVLVVQKRTPSTSSMDSHSTTTVLGPSARNSSKYLPSGPPKPGGNGRIFASTFPLLHGGMWSETPTSVSYFPLHGHVFWSLQSS